MRRRIVLIVAAGLLALAGTTALWAYVAGADARALAGKEAVEVLVAADAIPAGASFAEAQQQGLVEKASFPLGAVPVGAFTDPTQAQGLIATRAIEPHELLLAANFGPPDTTGPATGGLAVPAGKVALPVSLQHFANSADWAGYLQPGAEIALFETFTSAGGPAGATPRGDGLALEAPNTQVTRLLVDRLTVLAVAGAVEAEAGTAGTAIVLAVDQQQSEKIILGLNSGVALYPVLLTADLVVVPSPGTDNSRIFDTPGTAP
ncbi:Flp pilus assembly protein CpaB [Pseudonocardia bannensis]|uniref:Flp pilus assembly protein CpaB n=1 Tax=Pseudonocardia bannensis TaxID=630973 RepID=UPI001B7CDDC6|nr:SAF domain-containing protein [Pseudonocardia bannensis]